MMILKKFITINAICILIVLSSLTDKFTTSANAQPSANAVIATVWSPDGTMIAGAGSNGLLRIWHENGTTLLDFPNLNGTFFSVTWSPDSQKIASSGNDLIIRVWNVKDSQFAPGALLATFEGHRDRPVFVAWSPDGTRLASVSIWDNPSLKVWDVVTYAPQPIAEQRTSNLHKVTWSPDGSQLAVASETGILVFDSSLNILPFAIPANHRLGPDQSAISVVWSPDGSQIAGGYYDAKLKVWDVNTKIETANLVGHTDYIGALSWGPDSLHLASASGDGTVRIWNPDTGAVEDIYSRNRDIGVFSIAWSPDGTKLAYGDTNESPTIVTTLDNTIGNRIWLDANGNGIQDAGEMGMPGLTVHLLNNNFGIVQTVQTNAYGFYTFADLVPDTNYYVQIIPPADTYTIAPVDRGADDTLDSDFDWRDNFGTPDPTDRVLRSMRFTASAGMQRDDLDAGFMPNSDLDVRVWRDTDGDGVQDGGEQGMAGVSLFLRRANFTRYRDPLTTDSDGFATFTNLPAGDYYVQIDVPSGYSLAPFNIGPDDNIDNDFAMAFDYETGSGNVPRTLRFTLAPGVLRENIDAGLKQP